MLEDKVLIWKYNRGRTEVLGRVYEKYKDELMTLATALLYDRQGAEDVVQDVFVSLIRSCGQRSVRENLKGYLTTSVANRVRNANKAGQKHEILNPAAAENQADDREEALWSDRQVEQLGRALHEISYEQREVIVLRLYSGMTFKVIARTQGLSINTIQGRYRYGIGKLRSLLNGEVEK